MFTICNSSNDEHYRKNYPPNNCFIENFNESFSTTIHNIIVAINIKINTHTSKKTIYFHCRRFCLVQLQSIKQYKYDSDHYMFAKSKHRDCEYTIIKRYLFNVKLILQLHAYVRR